MVEPIPDGIVASWPRWYILSCAYAVVLGYIVIAVTIWVRHLFFGVPVTNYLDWRYLIMILPMGVIMGERGYMADLKLNDRKDTLTKG